MKHYDIIVVGGGFAGATAAIAAARQQKSVLLIEKYNCLGGAAVYDLVNPFMPYWTKHPESGEKIMLSAGIFTEILDRLEAVDAFIPNGRRTAFNEEYLKLVLNRMAVESGVTLLYQTVVTGVTLDGKRILSLRASNVSGESEFSADVYIDATGDANLSMLAGFPFRLGRESDSLCQPMTLCFRLANVDTAEFAKIKPQINPLYREKQRTGEITNPRENVLVFSYRAPGVLHFNTTRVVKLNPTDAFDVTQAELIAREQVFEIFAFLKTNFPTAFGSSELVSTGIQIGVRESRMIEGEYTLTKDDLLACTRFDDGIAACNYDIDIHSPDGSGTSHYYFPDGQYYTIPYRTLVPKNSENLLVAGRCISASHDAQASLRIMPTCATLGEAAGIAASIATEGKQAVGKIDVQRLRDLLRKNGAVID